VTIRQPLRARLAPIGLAGFFVLLTLVAGDPTAAPVFGAIGAVAALITLRMRLTVDAEGVTVVNIRPRRIPWLDIVAVSTGIPNRFATGQFLVFHRRSGPPIWSWAVSVGGRVPLGYSIGRVEQIAAEVDRYRQDLASSGLTRPGFRYE
jgi:hypothetical protein